MMKNLSLKTLLPTLMFGILMATGTYFVVPTPQNAAAGSCDETYIIQSILYCIDGSNIRNGKLITYCDG